MLAAGEWNEPAEPRIFEFSFEPAKLAAEVNSTGEHRRNQHGEQLREF
jgi:hypothetical protein